MLPAHIPPAPALPWTVPPMLKGQAAIVTGGSSGIGRAIAIELARAGADVLVNYLGSEEKAADVVKEIKGLGGRAFAHRADVSREADVLAMFAAAREQFGTVHLLINNAGLQADAALTEMTLEQWERVISVNLTGQFLCAREAVREFRRRGIVPEVSCAA